MCEPRPGGDARRSNWLCNLLTRIKRPAPVRVPPSWHAPTHPGNTRPGGGGNHRRSDGGEYDAYKLPDGRIVTFRRRP